MGLPLARDSSAARPADEAMSRLLAFRYSSARLLPALNTHFTWVPFLPRSSSSQPKRLSTRLEGE